MADLTLRWSKKRPVDHAPYTVGFGDWLTAKTSTNPRDTIATATVSTSDPALTASGAIIVGDNVTTQLSGGVAGNVYTITITITTSAGLTKAQPVLIQVV